MNILFIGNFEAPHSTENDRAWSFNQLGHNVIAVQENWATVKDLDELTFHPKKDQKIDLVIYSHTHGWEIPELHSYFKRCKATGIPTASVHLDRWAWLERANDVGKEATWATEWQFMADASPEAVDLYNGLGLKWSYLKPGVIARDCYMAEPDKKRFPHEIIFVGSKNYHPEYKFRPRLVQWLQASFGDNFGHYGPDGIAVLRGGDLNIALATAKIVVGDSCFGGRPNYVSDRYYETRGRGGFLMHPHVEGHEMEGVGHYNARDLNDLQNQINFYLGHKIDRERMRKEGFEWVKNHGTYTHRAHQMLTTIFGEQPPMEAYDAKRQD